MGITFKLIKYIGTLAKSEKGEKKLQLVSWNNETPCYDIRTWKSDGKATSGITLSKEDLLRIVELVKGNEDDTEDFPISKPFEDTSEPDAKKTTTKAKPVEKATTKTNYTYSDCEKKLDKMFEKYNELDSFRWLLGELKKLAKKDNQFVQNIMRESRTIDNMTLYARDKTYEKYNSGFMGAIVDADMLNYCVEYLNQEEIKIAKTTTKSAKTTSRKTSGRKTKSTKNDDVVIDLPFN